VSDLSSPAPGRLWGLTLLAIATGSALIPINSTMLAVALPAIMNDLQVGAATVSWLVTAYLAAVALAMPIAGVLGDRLGFRRMYLLGVAGFAATSVIAAVAQTFALLIIARVLQAASGAAITANAASLIRAAAPEDRRGGSYGFYDMLISTSAAVGPFLGGLLVGGFGWRSLFTIAVPVGLVSGFVVAAVVPPRQRSADARAPLDGLGLGLVAAALLSLLVTLFEWRNGGVWVWSAAAFPVLLGILVRHERRVPRPAVDVRLFSVRSFSAAVAAVLGATVILHASLILLPILTQTVMDASPAASGTVLLMLSGLGAVVSPVGGRLSDRYGRRLPAVIGSACMAAGLAVLWLVTGRVALVGLTAALALVGIGSGFSGPSRQAAALESVPEHAIGMAAGTYFTSRYVGGVLGASLAGVVLAGGTTATTIAQGFGTLAVVGLAVTAVSFGLRGRSGQAPAPA